MRNITFATFTCILFIALVLSGCAQESRNQGGSRFQNVLSFTQHSLDSTEFARFKQYLKLIESDLPEMDEIEYFVSQEILDYTYDFSIAVYAYFDWKNYVFGIEDYAEERMKIWSSEDVEYESPLNSEGSADIRFETHNAIGDYLKSRGYLLINIDCNCDCYRVIVIPDQNLDKLRSDVRKLRCELELYNEVW